MSVQASRAQGDFFSQEKELAYHADVMTNAYTAAHRLKSGKLFTSLFETVLEQEGSYQYPFDSLLWISRMEPPSGRFRLFTWSIKGAGNTIHYYGILQFPSGKRLSFKDNGGLLPDGDFSILQPENWFGQVYYSLYEQTDHSARTCILFGYRDLPGGNRIKMATPLVVDDETCQFGQELFYKDGSRHGRTIISIEYLAESNALLRFDPELKGIVFDHLIPVMNPRLRNETIYVPDGTLEGYFPDKDKWVYRERVFTEVYENAPVPQPILKNRDKDLFGK